MIRRPPRSPLFPYTPLSRSVHVRAEPQAVFEADSVELVELLLGEGERRGARFREDTEHLARLFLEVGVRSEEHTSELQSRLHLVCRLLLEKKKTRKKTGDIW